jgi:hypothetical protein
MNQKKCFCCYQITELLFVDLQKISSASRYDDSRPNRAHRQPAHRYLGAPRWTEESAPIAASVHRHQISRWPKNGISKMIKTCYILIFINIKIVGAKNIGSILNFLFSF